VHIDDPSLVRNSSPSQWRIPSYPKYASANGVKYRFDFGYLFRAAGNLSQEFKRL
jgi:hypothetical protein